MLNKPGSANLFFKVRSLFILSYQQPLFAPAATWIKFFLNTGWSLLHLDLRWDFSQTFYTATNTVFHLWCLKMAKLVAHFWQGRREERRFLTLDGGNSSGPLSFLGSCWVSPPLLCVTAQPALQISKVLAEITCHSNKILSLSKLEFGEDPNGITNFTNQTGDMPLAFRSLFAHGMKWLSKRQCWELKPRKNGHCEGAGYLVILCTSCVYLYQTDIF